MKLTVYVLFLFPYLILSAIKRKHEAESIGTNIDRQTRIMQMNPLHLPIKKRKYNDESSAEVTNQDVPKEKVACTSKVDNEFSPNYYEQIEKLEREVYKRIESYIEKLLKYMRGAYSARLERIRNAIVLIRKIKHLLNDKKFVTTIDLKLNTIIAFFEKNYKIKLSDYKKEDYVKFCSFMNDIIKRNRFRSLFESSDQLKWDNNEQLVMCIQFLRLFKHFERFPKLTILGTLFVFRSQKFFAATLYLMNQLLLMNNKEADDLIHLLIEKNLANKNTEINTWDKVYAKVLDFSIRPNICFKCNKNHSSLYFLLWEFDRNARNHIKVRIELFLEHLKITRIDVEHFRLVMMILIYQHFIYMESRVVSVKEIEIIKKLFFDTTDKCPGCIFDDYIKLLKN